MTSMTATDGMPTNNRAGGAAINPSGDFCAHTRTYITGELAVRARVYYSAGMGSGSYNLVFQTAIQFIYNVCGQAIYANMTKEASYERIQPLISQLSAAGEFVNRDGSYDEEGHACSVLYMLEDLSNQFALMLKDFKYT